MSRMNPIRSALICLLLITVAFFATAHRSALAQEKPKNDPTVYVTKTGDKYHADGCKYLAKSKIAKPLSQAKKTHSPCSVCSPPK